MRGQRVGLGAAGLYLATLVVVAAFADLLVQDSPIVASRGGRIEVLPALTQGARDGDPIVSADSQPDWAIWPAVRASPVAPSAEGALAPPSSAHPLGTDANGVDVLAQVVHGARVMVVSTLGVALTALLLGVLAGALAGAGPRFFDGLLARAVEISGALPTLIVLALVQAIIGSPSLLAFVIVVAIVRTIEVARLVRGEFLRVGGQDFVVAARALGATPARVARRHVLPHVLAPALVSTAFAGASVVGLDAALGFLGLAASREASWGALLGQIEGGAGAAVLLWPALGAVTTIGAFYVLADGLDRSLGARRRAGVAH